jgi:hypothetical protein
MRMDGLEIGVKMDNGLSARRRALPRGGATTCIVKRKDKLGTAGNTAVAYGSRRVGAAGKQGGGADNFKTTMIPEICHSAIVILGFIV